MKGQIIMAIKNKKCCVCGSYTHGRGLSNDLGTCVCLNCARAIRDIMLLDSHDLQDNYYVQPVLQGADCYIPPIPVNREK